MRRRIRNLSMDPANPGDPDQSIFIYRLQTTKPGDMMPELGRSTSHEEGVALIAEWISAMDGGCG